MFADEQHRVNGEFIAAASECFGDSGIDSEAEFTGPFFPLVSFWPLSCVERDDFHIWTVPPAFARIADKKPVGEVLRVG